jgi:ribosomal protein S5
MILINARTNKKGQNVLVLEYGNGAEDVFTVDLEPETNNRRNFVKAATNGKVFAKNATELAAKLGLSSHDTKHLQIKMVAAWDFPGHDD